MHTHTHTHTHTQQMAELEYIRRVMSDVPLLFSIISQDYMSTRKHASSDPLSGEQKYCSVYESCALGNIHVHVSGSLISCTSTAHSCSLYSVTTVHVHEDYPNIDPKEQCLHIQLLVVINLCGISSGQP